MGGNICANKTERRIRNIRDGEVDSLKGGRKAGQPEKENEGSSRELYNQPWYKKEYDAGGQRIKGGKALAKLKKMKDTGGAVPVEGRVGRRI